MLIVLGALGLAVAARLAVLAVRLWKMLPRNNEDFSSLPCLLALSARPFLAAAQARLGLTEGARDAAGVTRHVSTVTRGGPPAPAKPELFGTR